MLSSELAYLADIVRRRSGIQLSADKSYLLESRLLPVAKRYGCHSVSELAKKLRSSLDEELTVAVVDAMTTNESLFFRDGHPFEQFKTFLMPEMLKSRPAHQEIRIWSAAASTGQEPYSLAICLDQISASLNGRKISILATDLSNEALARAKEGVFSQFEVQRGLPTPVLLKYFKQDGKSWRINDAIKRKVKFAKHNLIESNKSLGRFDIVFLRNVLIYFDVATKKRILADISHMIGESGVLCLGGSESIIGLNDHLKPIAGRRGLFQNQSQPVERRAALQGQPGTTPFSKTRVPEKLG